jgi:hypothetical protein
MPELLREVTGIDPERDGLHVLLDDAGIRATQRLALTSLGTGVAVVTWPAELQPQAKYLYDGARAPRLLAAAASGGWIVESRPHLAFWRAHTRQRLYLTPAMSVEEYVQRWAGDDGEHISQHAASTIRSDLWPWLLERGFASTSDAAGLDQFLATLNQRPAHLRPALRLTRRWDEGAAAELIRDEVNRLLASVGDPALPVQRSARQALQAVATATMTGPSGGASVYCT